MPSLPVLSGQEAIRAFGRAGWLVDSRRGSHVGLWKPGARMGLSIPLHKELGPGILCDQIRKAGMTVEEFLTFLK